MKKKKCENQWLEDEIGALVRLRKPLQKYSWHNKVLNAEMNIRLNRNQRASFKYLAYELELKASELLRGLIVAAVELGPAGVIRFISEANEEIEEAKKGGRKK